MPRARWKWLGFALAGAALAAIADRAVAPRAGAAPTATAVSSAESPLLGLGKVEVVRDGFVFVEGLRWVPALSALLVSDAYGETIYQLVPPRTLAPFRRASNGANGLDLDPAGHLVAAEVGAEREKQKGAVSRQRADGTWGDAIADHRGVSLAHPNDVVALPDGTIFFSDLGLGHRLWRIDRAGALSHPLEQGDERMNGLALSPDRTILYTSGGGLRAWDLRDGQIVRQRAAFATEPKPDGMCVDTAGNLYVGTQNGLQVLNTTTGASFGVIALPGMSGQDRATECAFADADARTLYVSAVSKLYRVRTARPGVY